jgi:hypothetical protein
VITAAAHHVTHADNVIGWVVVVGLLAVAGLWLLKRWTG